LIIGLVLRGEGIPGEEGDGNPGGETGGGFDLGRIHREAGRRGGQKKKMRVVMIRGLSPPRLPVSL
jgi:hypothetical protein